MQLHAGTQPAATLLDQLGLSPADRAILHFASLVTLDPMSAPVPPGEEAAATAPEEAAAAAHEETAAADGAAAAAATPLCVGEGRGCSAPPPPRAVHLPADPIAHAPFLFF